MQNCISVVFVLQNSSSKPILDEPLVFLFFAIRRMHQIVDLRGGKLLVKKTLMLVRPLPLGLWESGNPPIRFCFLYASHLLPSLPFSSSFPYLPLHSLSCLLSLLAILLHLSLLAVLLHLSLMAACSIFPKMVAWPIYPLMVGCLNHRFSVMVGLRSAYIGLLISLLSVFRSSIGDFR